MIKKILMSLILMSGYANGHADECVVCAGHKQYEFQGAMNTARAQESFWRQEELACEKQWLAHLRERQTVKAPHLAGKLICECKQNKSGLSPKLNRLQKMRARISRR